jgi:oligopeptide/dipeptide ABC transporter ATP-binding protein
MSALLTVRDLMVSYPLAGGLVPWPGNRPARVDVVTGVSFDIQRGETMAIVGESGSGKTTLAMALCGLAPALAGEVQFAGQALERDSNHQLRPDRRRVALMFQDAVGSLSPRMTVGRLLAEPLTLHGMGGNDPRGEALRLLSIVGLGEEFASRYPHQLSGGQARRVGVARALALGPELLFADEPTAGLDVSIQGEVLNLLSHLQAEMGLAIMIITHNLNVVRHVADRMAIMYLGRFIEQGDSAQIFAHPRHPYTAALLSANPSPDPDTNPERMELTGEPPGLLSRPAGCEFHTRCPRAAEKCRESFPPSAVDAGQHRFNCFFPIENP